MIEMLREGGACSTKIYARLHLKTYTSFHVVSVSETCAETGGCPRFFMPLGGVVDIAR
jgi:hypothetical protein